MVKPAIQTIEQRQMRFDHYYIKPGDKVAVHTKIIEGEKQRIQIFKGDVIAIKNGRNNNRTTITVRKMTSGFGVEKIITLHSPLLEKI
jgi:large subunit ribosomal protein L19